MKAEPELVNLPEGLIPLLLRNLDEAERGRFLDGLDKHVHRLSADPGPETAHALLRFVAKWGVRVLLTTEPGWQAQMADSERRIAAGNLGEPVDSPGLRDLLQR